jgi:pimeloyl-ACP methyl ester carboxylesterase
LKNLALAFLLLLSAGGCAGAIGSSSLNSEYIPLPLSAPPTPLSASKIGPLHIQNYTSGIAIPSGDSWASPTIWYPTDGDGNSPGIVFVPGMTTDYRRDAEPEEDFAEWGRFLASHGWIVMFINPSDMAATPPTRATVLLQAAKGLLAESARPGSPIFQKLNPQQLAVIGHSFGGAGALYAGNSNSSDPVIKAAIGLSPVPTAGYYTASQTPSLVIGCEGDMYFTDFRAEYDSIPAGTPKLLAKFIKNGEFSNTHRIGMVPLGTHSTDPVVARLVLSFLSVYVQADMRFQQFLVGNPALVDFGYSP